MSIKLWVDDVRPAPEGYIWCKSVNETKKQIIHCVNSQIHIDVIDLDHDAGEYYHDGGDYIKVLDWLEEKGYDYPIRIHTMNAVGSLYMEVICRKNRWLLI